MCICKLRTFIIIVPLLLLTGCGFILLPPLEVESCKIADFVEVVFSEIPSQVSVQKAFSLTEDDITVEGAFVFDGRKVLFIPENGIQYARDYYVTITDDVEDMRGISLTDTFNYAYTTRKELLAPTIMRCIPNDETTTNGLTNTIEIYFSEPIDTASFTNAFSISPTFDYFTTFHENNSLVKLTATEPLKKGARYTISVSTDLQDLERNSLEHEYVVSFANGFDNEAPRCDVRLKDFNTSIYSGTTNTSIPSDAILLLNFSEEIIIDTIGTYISISPPLGMSLVPNLIQKNEVTVNFSSVPTWGKEYALTIKKGIQDTYGNTIPDDTLYSLTFNNERNRPVTFLKGYIKTETRTGLQYVAIGEKEIFESIIFEAEEYPKDELKETEAYFVFSVSNEAKGIEQIHYMNNFSVEATGGCIDIVAKSITILTKEEYMMDASYSVFENDFYGIQIDGIISVVKVGFEITNTENKGIVTFNLGEGIMDSLGNTMQSSLEYSLNKG